MASQKSGSDSRKVRVPEAVEGIQVNHCKNPVCENFGLAARNKGKDPAYTRVGANSRPPRIGEKAKSIPPSVRCKSCGETIPLKSNAGVVDTIDILTWRPETFCCPQPECENTSVDLRTTPDAYYRHGKTRQGTPRFRCRACGQTFVTQGRRRPQRAGERPYRTEQVVKALLNSMPINRIIEIFSIHPQTIYDIIDRAYEACLVFAAEREIQLGAKAAGRGDLYIATDRQSYTLNWRLRADKRNTVLRAIVSTEVLSGYVFPVHLNYDARSDVTQVNEIAMLLGDPQMPGIWRRFPHYWLLDDYAEGIFRVREDAIPQETLAQLRKEPLAHVRRIYRQALKRWDVEAPSDQLDTQTKLPDEGLQLREEYVLYAHFSLLRRWLEAFDEAHFFVDQESGIRAAYMAAFHDWVLANRSHLFYTKVKGAPTREEREAAARERDEILEEARQQWGSVGRGKIELLKIALQANSQQQGHWHDRWTPYPWGSSGEVEKTFSHQTARPEQDLERLAEILLHCSLLPTERFLQRARRRLSPLERGVPTAAGNRRIWTGRAPYNPKMIIKLLELLRVYVNYCEAPNRNRGNTPAMDLGLARGPVELRKIL
ncbi:IS1 family transposase [Sediminicurvatus halobius]|uniref:IS1 family transposase n=1 Tax=Sediminicurvatus halobius TaxID=2182432 RepID=UPI0011B268AD|nr:IS1 family transposase [Spiribacter halobius]UEX77991.1 hypothetical protein LMH63_19025 [Spiribacter halobius]